VEQLSILERRLYMYCWWSAVRNSCRTWIIQYRLTSVWWWCCSYEI